MNQASKLTLTYLTSHPADAARVLDTLAAEHAGAFLASVPSRIGAPVFAEMLPYRAARCLSAADEETQANLLRRLGVQHGGALLRHLESAHRTRLLARLPTGRAIALRLMLGYPEDTIGAWVDPEVLVLSQDSLVSEALERVRHVEYEPGSHLYVLDEERQLLGSVTIARLVRSIPAQPISHVMDSPSHTFSAQSALASVRAHAAWSRHHSVPVVESRKRFIGILHQSTVSRAFEAPPESGVRGGVDQVLIEVGTLYWQGVAGLIQFAVSLLPVTAGSPSERRSP